MNRKHTAREYLDLVSRIRKAQPELALSTDIIVGFPGETDAEFEETLTLVAAVGFAQAYSFKYSARPGTPASNLADQVPDAVKTERLAWLQALLDRQQAAFNARCVGRTLPVLFEKPGRRPGQLVGRSPYLQAVHAEAGSETLGRVLPVEISSFGPNSLAGVIRSAR
jgi:tRNA-2-methylthio-N6-dimethylallyladenosine synthase